jgi:hypothetical protein
LVRELLRSGGGEVIVLPNVPGKTQSNPTFDRTAGSHSLAAAGQGERSPHEGVEVIGSMGGADERRRVRQEG